MNLKDLIHYEQQKTIENIIKNSIISNKYEENKIKLYLSKQFNEINNIIMSNPNNIEKIYNKIIDNFWNKIKIITKNVPGISIGIKDNNTNNELYIFHGKTTDEPHSHIIDENTKFDLASITKLFTTIRVLKEEENNNLDTTKSINYYDHNFKNIDAEIEKALKFYYKINTDKRLDEAINKEQLTKRLYNSKIITTNTFEYSDIPYIMVGQILQNINSDFYNIFHKELNMINTSYNTKNNIITGGYKQKLNKIHDPKAQKLTEYGFNQIGHAGLYSTSKDLITLGANLLPNNSFLSKKSIKKLITPSNEEIFFLKNKKTYTYKNRAMGVYIQTPLGIKQSDISIISSKEAFAAAGATGPYMLIDPTNNFTFNYLINPYSQDNIPQIIDKKKWTTATNLIKEELMNLVFELRYLNNIYDKYTLFKNSEFLSNQNQTILKRKKIIKR